MNYGEDDYNMTQNEVDELNVLQDLLEHLHMGKIMGWRDLQYLTRTIHIFKKLKHVLVMIV